jgi:hypothetical protein
MVNSIFKAALIFLGCMGTVAQAKVFMIEGDNQTTYEFDIDGVYTSPVNVMGKDFLKVELMGVEGYEAVRYSIGKPEIPVIRLIVEGDVAVEAESGAQTGLLKNGMRIKPSQPSWSKSEKNEPGLAIDFKAYQASVFENRPSYEIESVGSYRGRKRYMVTLNALEYNPALGVYRLTSKYKVTVNKQRIEAPTQPLLAMVVGARFADSPAVVKLKSLKQAQGFRVRTLVVGRDVQDSSDAIREALRSMYLAGENLEFALLVGDVSDVPSHESEHIYGVTDHYYRAIDSEDYDSDINSPDIGVGRISVSSEVDLDVIVAKIERYLSGKFLNAMDSGTNGWLRHPAFIATHDRYQVAEATHNKVIQDFFAPRDYSRVFPDETEKGGDKLFPITLGATRRQIVEHIAQGRFIINFSGHGSHSGWEDVSANDVLGFKHPSALPWVLSNSCITGDFREEPVFAETWLRHPNGAINFWGSMDSTYWDEDDILEKALYREVFTRGVSAFDRIYQGALGEVWRHYGGANRSKYYWETYVTFGDPSLNLRIDRPKSVQVQGPGTLLRGQQKANWQILSAGRPAEGAHVVLVRESDGVVVSSRADGDGNAFLDLERFGVNIEPLKLYVHGPDLEISQKDIGFSSEMFRQ